jgi:hypothetical protein
LCPGEHYGRALKRKKKKKELQKNGTDIFAPKSTISTLLQNLCGQKDQITLSTFIFFFSLFLFLYSLSSFSFSETSLPFSENGSLSLINQHEIPSHDPSERQKKLQKRKKKILL